MEDNILSSYKIGKTIGRGTFGKVKKGIHKITSQPVAIKILEKSRIKDVTDVERVSRQLHILKIVRHSAIAQLYQIIETQDTIFIVMEYAEGGQFFEFIMDGKIESQNHAYYYFSQILDALQYLHENKIAHRDVKPENILLDTHQKLKLVDFGLSNMYKNGQILSTACGSPCYASPQMIRGEQYNPQLTDVWSLGIVLYTTFFAKLPFQDDNTSVLYSRIKSGIYLIEKRVSADLKDLLSKMLHIKPSKRIGLRSIRQHPWCKNKQVNPTHGIKIGYQKIPIDDKILRQILLLQMHKDNGVKGNEESESEFEKNFDRLRKQIENNVKNPMTATYYLLLKKNFKSGRGSSSDICSVKFDVQQLTSSFPKKKTIDKMMRHKSLDVTSVPTYQKENENQSKPKQNEKYISTQLEKSEIKQPRVFHFSLQRQRKPLKDSSHQQKLKRSKTPQKFDFIYPKDVIAKVVNKSRQGQEFIDTKMKVNKQRAYTQGVSKMNDRSESKKRLNIQNFMETRKRLKTENSKLQSKITAQINKKLNQKMTELIFKVYLPKDSLNRKDCKKSDSRSKQKNIRVRSKQKPINSRNQNKQKILKKGKTQQLDIAGVFWKKKSSMDKGHTKVTTKANY